MEMNAMERLNQIVHERGPLLAGLDPDPEKIGALLEKSVDTWTDKNIITLGYAESYLRSLSPVVGAVKINSAFFEAWRGTDAFFDVAKMAKQMGYFVIADVKRADIGNTSQQYAKAFLGEGSPVDAMTVNPYFGTDGIRPFLDMAKANGKGIFVLVKTSNPSSAEIQNLVLQDSRKLYERVAELTREWGEYTSEGNEKYNLVGAVVGATHPTEAAELRKLMPNTFFLVPGYGAQGATAQDIVVNFDNDGGGAIVNSSRGLMFACNSKRWEKIYSKDNWAQASFAEAERAQKELKEAVANHLAK